MVLDSALEGEISDHLDYQAGDPAGRNRGNSRNGHKRCSRQIGPVELDVPRNRRSTFEPRIVRKRQRRLGGIEEFVIWLSAKRLTTGEVVAHLAEIYGAEVSR
jgi:transposase-like protein